ncbi:hypothetical protein GCM10009854_36400 [Saccharopolyspora halophila]|uniref:Uncharacterized protein n=2 Tax=Saccharopolyspora halophila TaxID=405551 RepID=A0ABN3GLU9_9PSEU
MNDLAGGSGGDSPSGGGLKVSKALLIVVAGAYLVAMGVVQYNFSRMHDQLDSVTSNLERTNAKLSALSNLELLKAEMSKLDEDIVAMRELMGPFPDMAESVGALNGQIASLSGTIAMLQSDTSGLPSVAVSIQRMSTELRGITERMNEMNRTVAGAGGSVSGMQGQVASIQGDLGELQEDVADMNQRLKIIPKTGAPN